MKTQLLGQGLEVSAIGLGCVTMESYYHAADADEAVATLHYALDRGINLIDTAAAYGTDSSNEKLVARALAGRRDDVVLCTKFGALPMVDGRPGGWDSRPETVRRSCDESLQRLGTDRIDLFYQHRVDPKVPVEETWGALSELVQAGKVRHLGISEPDVDSLRRAHATHPITAVQNEYSLFTRDIEAGFLDEVRRIGAGLVCFAPLGRGMLSGKVQSSDDLGPDDFRTLLPRFQGSNLEANLTRVRVLDKIAEARAASPAQLALAWLLSRGRDVVPIAGMEQRAFVDDNVPAAELELTPEELELIEEAFPLGAAAGTRYPEEF